MCVCACACVHVCVCVCMCVCVCVCVCVQLSTRQNYAYCKVMHWLPSVGLAARSTAQHEMHTLTFTACVQTASPPVAEVCVCIVPHKREQSRVVEEADALHTMGRNEEVGTQLGNVAN